MAHRTVIKVDVSVHHQFAVGDVVVRDETKVPCEIPDEDQVSIWTILEVGYTPGAGPWYRMAPENEIARLMALEAHSRVMKASAPLVELMGPVTERVATVDRMCKPHVQ